jgi:hypothetical protein
MTTYHPKPKDLEAAQEDAAELGYKWIQKPDGDWTVVKLDETQKKEDTSNCKHEWEYIDSFFRCKKCGKRIVIGE